MRAAPTRDGNGYRLPLLLVVALLLQLPLIFNPGYYSHDELQWASWSFGRAWEQVPWARLADIEHQLVIRPGRGPAKPPLYGPLACDWHVAILKDGVRPETRTYRFRVVIEVYAEGRVGLDELTLPETVRVERASE